MVGQSVPACGGALQQSRGLPGVCRWGCAGCRGSSSGLSPACPFWESRVSRRPEGGAGECVGEQGLPSLSGRVTLTHPTQGSPCRAELGKDLPLRSTDLSTEPSRSESPGTGLLVIY